MAINEVAIVAVWIHTKLICWCQKWLYFPRDGGLNGQRVGESLFIKVIPSVLLVVFLACQILDNFKSLPTIIPVRKSQWNFWFCVKIQETTYQIWSKNFFYFLGTRQFLCFISPAKFKSEHGCHSLFEPASSGHLRGCRFGTFGFIKSPWGCTLTVSE